MVEASEIQSMQEQKLLLLIHRKNLLLSCKNLKAVVTQSIAVFISMRCLLVCGGYAVLCHDIRSDMSWPTSRLMHHG